MGPPDGITPTSSGSGGSGGSRRGRNRRPPRPRVVVEESSPLLETPPGSPEDEQSPSPPYADGASTPQRYGQHQQQHVEPRVLYNPLSCPEAVAAAAAAAASDPDRRRSQGSQTSSIGSRINPYGGGGGGGGPLPAHSPASAVVLFNGGGGQRGSASTTHTLEPTYPWDLVSNLA